jgi:hypothetical protein
MSAAGLPSHLVWRHDQFRQGVPSVRNPPCGFADEGRIARLPGSAHTLPCLLR